MVSKKTTGFYVYVLLDPRKPGQYTYGFGESEIRLDYEPFYVGKGLGNRWRHHYHNTTKPSGNKVKDNKITKLTRLGYEPCVHFIIKGVPENLAYDVEGETILTIGRERVGTGPLLNVTDGRGMAGNAGFKLSEEAKAKISKAHKGKVVKESTKEKLRQFKGENSSHFGTTISEDLMRIKKVVHLQYKFTVKTPKGDNTIIYNINQFARDNNLSDSHLYQTFSGKRSHHKGYCIIDKEPLVKDWIYTDAYDEFLLYGGDDIKGLYAHMNSAEGTIH
jgi:hypothetical protein